MSYTLKKTVTKQNGQLWNVYFDISKSINNAEDERDNLSLYTAEEQIFLQSYFQKLKEGLLDYEGWNRNYIGEDTIEVDYLFGSESSARTYHSRLTTAEPSVEIEALKLLYRNKKQQYNIPTYSVTWKLLDENSDELVL